MMGHVFPKSIFVMEDVKRKFNIYAQAALPCEIGGIAKIEEFDFGLVVTDFAILPQEATGGTFEISEEEITKWTSKMLDDGRVGELHEWCSIIHSHPVGCDPFLSGTDEEAIKSLAAEGHAFSLIMEASRDATSNNFKMHYAQYHKDFGHVIVENIPVKTAISQAAADEIKQIKLHVKEMIKHRKPAYTAPKTYTSKYGGSYLSTNYQGNFSSKWDDDLYELDAPDIGEVIVTSEGEIHTVTDRFGNYVEAGGKVWDPHSYEILSEGGKYA